MYLEELPLRFKNNTSINHLFYNSTCKVSVQWIIYNPKKKNIVLYGSSRPRGTNYNGSSTHAEQIAWNKLKYIKNKDKMEIYIWRWNKKGEYVTKYSCNICTKLAYKYNFHNQLFTFNNGQKISAIIDNPPLCLSNIINNI